MLEANHGSQWAFWLNDHQILVNLVRAAKFLDAVTLAGRDAGILLAGTATPWSMLFTIASGSSLHSWCWHSGWCTAFPRSTFMAEQQIGKLAMSKQERNSADWPIYFWAVF